MSAAGGDLKTNLRSTIVRRGATVTTFERLRFSDSVVATSNDKATATASSTTDTSVVDFDRDLDARLLTCKGVRVCRTDNHLLRRNIMRPSC